MSARSIGAYELEGLLGEGGIGQVYAAQDKVLGRRVAIKMLRPELSRDRSFVERFYVEAKSLGNLNHTNITTLYALHTEGDDAFMVMELVHGLTIEALLARVGRLAVRDALAVLAQAAPGLRYAHRRGVIHRDIKPANLMLTDEGVVKIMDFGIARVRGSQHLTRVGEFCGTFVYASPEQIRGDDVDERSDLYSLAIVLYRMLAGNPPFEATNEYALMTAQLQQQPPPLAGHVAGLEAATEQALMRALAKRPEDRFASVEEFGRAIGAMALRGESVDILQQLYARALHDGDLEVTRVLPARPPPAERTEPSRLMAALPAAESGDRFRLPDALPPVAPTELPIASGNAVPKPRPPRRSAARRGVIAAAVLTIPLAFGGAYLALSEGLGLPKVSAKLSAPTIADTPAMSAPPTALQTAGPPPPVGTVKNKPLPPAETVKAEPPAPVETVKSEPPTPAETEKTEPPVPIEAAKAAPPTPAETAVRMPAPSAEMAKSAAVTPPQNTPVQPETKQAKLMPPAIAPPTPATGAPPATEAPAAGLKTRAPEPAATAAAAPETASAPVATRSEPPAPPPPSPVDAKPKEPASAGGRAVAGTRLASAQPVAVPAPAPTLGPQPPPGPPMPEGHPDLEGKVTGAKGLGEIEVGGRWIRIYGIVDNARGRRQEEHAKALIRYLKPSHNHLVCYRKPVETYRCYSQGQDIAQSALRERIVRLAPNAPTEYRSLLAEER